MRRRHDPFLKRLYRAGARDAITLFLPEIAAPLDWAALRWIDKEVALRGMHPRSLAADLVGETQDLEGRYVKVLIHPELQMEADAEMDWRAFQYNAGLLLREGDPGVRVLTVVFYHCAGTGGIQERQFLLDYYGKTLNLITYWSVGLGDLDAEPYAERDNPMGWALASWMRQQPEHRVELRLRLIEKILRFARGGEYQGLLLDTVQTYYRLSGAERRAQARLLQSERFGDLQEMAQTVLERLTRRARQEALRKGRQEGLQEGRQEGLQEGRLEALQQAAITVVRSRLSTMPQSVIYGIERLDDPARLEVFISEAATANSLEEIERLLSA